MATPTCAPSRATLTKVSRRSAADRYRALMASQVDPLTGCPLLTYRLRQTRAELLDQTIRLVEQLGPVVRALPSPRTASAATLHYTLAYRDLISRRDLDGA